jgi:hypothetical protein
MNAADFIRVIGVSHLLQPPLTLLLASPRGVNLRTAITPRTPLAAEVMTNMAFASVVLPTALGCLLAGYAVDTLQSGPARAFGLLLAAFWSWRLYRQLFALGPHWPATSRISSLLKPLLTLIFVVQGPCLGALILGSM